MNTTTTQHPAVANETATRMQASMHSAATNHADCAAPGVSAHRERLMVRRGLTWGPRTR